MESYEILLAAARAGIPAAVLRAASDSVDTTMPNFDRALNIKGEIDKLKALSIALCSPIRTFRLMAAHRRAMRGLNAALEWILQSGNLCEVSTRGEH